MRLSSSSSSSLFNVSVVGVFLWRLSLLCSVPEAYANKFFFCSLSHQTIIDVNVTVLSDGSLSFTKVAFHDSDEEGHGRSLRHSKHDENPTPLQIGEERQEFGLTGMLMHGENFDDATPALRFTAEEEVSKNSTPGASKVIQVRECTCSYLPRDFYCPTDREYCAIPDAYYTSQQDPVCLDMDSQEVFVESIWPILLIWFALAAVFCVFTWSGRNAFDYVISCCFPCWGDAILDAVVYGSESQQHRDRQLGENQSIWRRFALDRRDQFQSRYRNIVGRARLAEEGISPDSREFEIRTRVFKGDEKKRNNDQPAPRVNHQTLAVVPNHTQPLGEENDGGELDEDEHATSCAICFLVLEDGDRVGDIECEHLFHIECLKGWLTRRNVCPLCLQEGIAKPKGLYKTMPRRKPVSRQQEMPEQLQPGDRSAAL